MKKILEEDLLLLNKRIKDIEKQIFDLGKDFNEAVNQSSETWHDNAPFDVVRDKQTLLSVELKKLRTVRSEARLVYMKKASKVVVGSRVELVGTRTFKVMIGGDWVGREIVDGYTLVSSESPIAKSIMGKKLHDTVALAVGVSIITTLA
jgi:transcription elongation GreA/GreB family factor